MRARGVALLSLYFLLAIAGQALASGITNSSDDLRTGWYPGEAAITPELIEEKKFGEEWSTKVEGQVYAQPLLAMGTLFVATEMNKIYGLDPATGTAKWSATLTHGAPWNPADIGCADLTPWVGATATPVIDPATGIAYLTHKTYASGSSGEARWWMDAIDVATGTEKPGFPVPLEGQAQNIEGLKFNATNELQRPGLLLMDGTVYAGFGSHCDHDPYQGWVFGVSTSGTVKARWATDPNGAGIWQSGAGLTSDGSGRILLSTGNGFDPEPPIAGSTPPIGLGQAVVRLQVQPSGELKAVDFFAPYDANTLNTWDADFGSGGVTGLPNEYFGTGTSTPHLAVAVGKDGYVYLLNRDDLGGYGVGEHGQDNVVQRIGPNGGVWSRPGVWPGNGGWVYIPTASAGNSAGGSAGELDMYRYVVSAGKPRLFLEGRSSDAFGFSSGAPVITSNGTENGSAVVWTIWAPNGTGAGAQLRAYAPLPVEGKAVLMQSWPVGTSAKFSTPGVGQGRIYVGTRDGHVLGFGAPVASPLTGPRTEFPATVVGQTSSQNVTLTAQRELTIEAVTTTSSQFTAGAPSPKPPVTLKAGQKINVPVTFAPSGAGPQAGTLQVTANGSVLSFSLSGAGRYTGPKLQASPPVVTFGGTSVGSPLTAQVTVKNVGSEPLTLKTTPPKAPFSIEGEPVPGKLAPEESFVAQLRFEPKLNGSYTGELAFLSNGGNMTIGLTGIAAPPGLLSISPPRVDFGQVLVGHEAVRSFAITNTGGLPVKINISKPPIAGPFHAITSLPEGESVVGPEETVTESVRFAPTAVGPIADVWRITGQDSSGLHEVGFTGEGVLTSASLVGSVPGGGSLGFNAGSALTRVLTKNVLVRRSGKVFVRVHCAGGSGSCTGSITLRTLRAIRQRLGRAVIMTLATGRFRIAHGRSATIDLHLSKAGRTLLARQRTLRVRASTVTQEDGAGHAHVVQAVVTLRAAPGLLAH
ncbi:MAG: bamB 2 [Solirubrobacterales bacterium]|nr:bamB 2 [Solirubrobacterales bacterium]